MLLRPACLALALLAAASPASAQSSAPDDLSAMLRASWTAFLAGDRDRAIGVLETVATRAQAEGQPRIEGEARRHLAVRRYSSREQYAPRDRRAAARPHAVCGGRRSQPRGPLPDGAGRRSTAARASRPRRWPWRARRWPPSGSCTTRRAWSTPPKWSSTRCRTARITRPIRNEALAVVDANGKPLACGVLHEWADELFARGRGAEAFTRITEARDCFQRRRRARPRGAVAGQPRPRLPPARTPGRRARPVPGGAGAARVARVHRSRRRGPGDERHRRHAVDDGALRRGRRAVRGRPRACPADGAVDGPVLRRQPRRLQARARPVCRGAGAARRSHCRVARYAAPGASPHPARAGARGTRPDRRSGGGVRSRRGAGGGARAPTTRSPCAAAAPAS